MARRENDLEKVVRIAKNYKVSTVGLYSTSLLER